MPGRRSAGTVLGMLGGIGTGKSHVAQRAATLVGARLVDADALAHKALEGFAADGQLEQTLGEGFVRDGRPDVEALSARVFADPALLRRLEDLVHPPVHTAIQQALADFRAGEGPETLLILDVPLLIEVGLDRTCDAVWYVEVPDEVRAERASERGLTLEAIHEREAFQSPHARKRGRADLIIRNNVTVEDLDAQILAGLATLGIEPNDTLGSTPNDTLGSTPRDPTSGESSP